MRALHASGNVVRFAVGSVLHELCSDVHQGSDVPAGRTSCCAAFPNMKKVVVVRGKYPRSLLAGWRQFAKEWADDEEKCQNENPGKLPASQLYTIMVVENGGSDLESYHVEDFRAAKSIILQVCDIASEFAHAPDQHTRIVQHTSL